MTTSSISKELRKYRALAWALVVTLIISVALFIQFLSIDRTRAVESFSSSAAHATTTSAMRIAQLIGSLGTIGRDYLVLVPSDAQLLSMMDALNIDLTLSTLCVRDGDAVRVIRSGSEDKKSASDRCAADFLSSEAVEMRAGLDNFTTDLRITRSVFGDTELLELRVRDGGVRELRVSISSTVLLDSTLLNDAGLDIDSETVCLSLRIDGVFHQLTCHVGEIAAAVPEIFTQIESNALSISKEIETDGLHWRLVVQPHLQSLAGAITVLPFIMFGIALAIGIVACVFAYQSADKNIRLEMRADELRTRLQQLEQLEAQNSLLDQFAAMAAHDLQAPIRFIVSTAYLLIDELDELDRPELSQMAETQVEQGERMRALVLDLLEFCRAGQSNLVMSSVDTRALVLEEIKLLRAHQEYAQTHITLGSLPESLVCDADKFALIIRNLLGNAVKFSQVNPDPAVSINATRETFHGSWTFRIKDNGPGVAKEHHERIFRPFARLESSINGTGMGLAIVKIMIEQLGGTTWIDPDDMQGSSFCFSIPSAMLE